MEYLHYEQIVNFLAKAGESAGWLTILATIFLPAIWCVINILRQVQEITRPELQKNSIFVIAAGATNYLLPDENHPFLALAALAFNLALVVISGIWVNLIDDFKYYFGPRAQTQLNTKLEKRLASNDPEWKPTKVERLKVIEFPARPKKETVSKPIIIFASIVGVIFVIRQILENATGGDLDAKIRAAGDEHRTANFFQYLGLDILDGLLTILAYAGAGAILLEIIDIISKKFNLAK